MDEIEMRVASLEDLCLDRVVNLIPILGNELQGLSHALFKCLLPRCDDYRLALLHNIAVNKGLDHDIQTMWRKQFGSQASVDYRTQFKSNLHDPFWQCQQCLSTILNDPPSHDVDWYQRYMDMQCKRSLEKKHVSMTKDREALTTCSDDEESVEFLKNPLWTGSEDIIPYKPNHLFLSIQTLMALTRSPGACDLLAHHLHTFECKVIESTEYSWKDVTSALERFLRVVLPQGNLETLHIYEYINGKDVHKPNLDYACLLAMLLLGRLNDERENDVHTEQTLSMLEEGNSLESQETTLTDSPQRTDDFSADLYESCFDECPSQDECFHNMEPDSTSFQHILNVPDPGPSLGHSISNLVLKGTVLNPESCTALANGLVGSTSLQSLALLQCEMPECGWCEVMSALAMRAQNGLVLQELALFYEVGMFILRNHKSLFGQYCAQKLNEMLEAYRMQNHKMKSLKLELPIPKDCQLADNSYLPKYVPSVSSLTLRCGATRLEARHKLVSPVELALAIQNRDSVLTNFVLDRSSLNTTEVDTLLAATANSPMLKRLSVRNNCYSTSQPKGLLALLQHSGIHSLDLSDCSFLLKECNKEFQDDLVDALINNCSLQHLKLSDRKLGNEDLAILGRAFADTKRTKQQPGYCLNLWGASHFSSRALRQFYEMLSKDVGGCHSNKRLHSLDHLSIHSLYIEQLEPLQSIIPRVSCMCREFTDVSEIEKCLHKIFAPIDDLEYPDIEYF